MESAALFVVADALGCRCGSVFHVIWNQEREQAGLDQKMSEDTSAAVKIGVDALKIMIKKDRIKKEKKMIEQQQIKVLAEQALLAQKRAIVPISHFAVGAALMAEDGENFLRLQYRMLRTDSDDLC